MLELRDTADDGACAAVNVTRQNLTLYKQHCRPIIVLSRARLSGYGGQEADQDVRLLSLDVPPFPAIADGSSLGVVGPGEAVAEN